MKRLLLAGVLVFSLGSCSDPADSPECKRWQSRYEGADVFTGATEALVRAKLLEERPDGCPIP
jgi:hypothetical protein